MRKTNEEGLTIYPYLTVMRGDSVVGRVENVSIQEFNPKSKMPIKMGGKEVVMIMDESEEDGVTSTVIPREKISKISPQDDGGAVIFLK